MWMRRAKVDCALSYTDVPNILCAHAARFAGVRLCAWNQRDEGRVNLSTMTARVALFRATYFVSNSEDGIDFLWKGGIPRHEVNFVRNGVRLDAPLRSAVEWRAKLEIPSKALVGCMIGNLHSNKDHYTLLRAWKYVSDKLDHDNAKPILVLAGRRDAEYSNLLRLCSRLDIHSQVRFAGSVGDVAGLLRSVDFGVFSSRTEGCPNGVLECMASGLSVAATDLRGIRDALGPSGVQFLAPPSDAQALAKRILRLLGNAELRQQIGLTNQQRVTSRFSVLGMQEAMVALLLSALDHS